MRFKLGVVATLVFVVMLLLLSDAIPISESLRAPILAGLFLTVGATILFKAEQLISPMYASSRFFVWPFRLSGLSFFLLGIAGFVQIARKLLGA